jgi:DNA-binding LytR/AlgR family response regulator
LVSSRDFSLAILDLNLKGQSTLELALLLKAKGVPVIFCTGYQDAALPEALANVTVLTKPVQKDALAGAISREQVRASPDGRQSS